MPSMKSLKARLSAKTPLQIMAAHSPISALIAEEAGFDGIWASGFELSALYGLPDASLITMTQQLDMVRAMAARVSVPIVADVDTGYGNAINVIHTVRQFEQAGAGAVVIEDKTFPKTTSLLEGGRQQLLRIEEFQGKVEAATDARASMDFLIIARTEALIAGRGEAEALSRAAAYEEAGADLILVHSKQATPDEIERFARAWRGKAGLVIVPTAYPQMTVARAEALEQIRMVIYGNHAMRAAVMAMQKTFRRIVEEGGIETVGDDIVPVTEIFRLQNMDEMKRQEQNYLR